MTHPLQRSLFDGEDADRARHEEWLARQQVDRELTSFKEAIVSVHGLAPPSAATAAMVRDAGVSTVDEFGHRCCQGPDAGLLE